LSAFHRAPIRPWSGRYRLTGIAVALLAVGAALTQPMSAQAQPAGGQDLVIDEYTLPGAADAGTHTQHVVHARQGIAAPSALGKPAAAPVERGPVVSPALRSLMGRQGGGTVRVVVSVNDTVSIPQFPDRTSDEPATSPGNLARAARSRDLVTQIQGRRAEANKRWHDTMAGLGGRVTADFWLSQGYVAELPLSAVARLAADPDVRGISSADIVSPLPDSDPANDASAARTLMKTDAYRGFARSSDTIALLDSGINRNRMLTGVITQINDETGSNPPIFTDICGHGTRSASALAGTSVAGASLQGVTSMKVEVFQTTVFGPDGNGNIICGTSLPAAIKAIEDSVQAGFRMIVAEMQMPETPDSVLDLTADNAFGAGAVVVAAAGNFDGTPGSVRAPGNARNVIGVGAVDVKTFIPSAPQGHGPTADGRIKPDIVTPTNYETGAPDSFTATGVYTGTSAATAAAGGEAAALRAFLRGSASTVNPGLVNAGLIMSGSHPFPFDNGEGAGKSALPNSGQMITSGVTVGTGQFVDVPFTVTASSCKLSAALWWPTAPQSPHNDVDLEVYDPAGRFVMSSTSGPSDFELARTAAGVAGGTWTLRVKAFGVFSPQPVFVAAATCR
jgi:serine protease AprX